MNYLVAFISPKRSAKVLETASKLALAVGAEMVILKVIPNPQKLGVVAELIASEKPIDKAQQQVDQVVAQLEARGIKARGLVRVDEVAKGIIKAAVEEKTDMLFAGTVGKPGVMQLFANDPIVNYLVEHCPTSLCLVRQEEVPASEDDLT